MIIHELRQSESMTFILFQLLDMKSARKSWLRSRKMAKIISPG